MLKKIDQAAINNFQYLKEYLTSPDQVTPNNELMIMTSSIGLIDAIIQGKLVICQEEPDVEAPAAHTETE